MNSFDSFKHFSEFFMYEKELHVRKEVIGLKA